MRAAYHRKEGDIIKVPRLMKTLMALFACIALIRAVNGAGAFSVMDLLVDLQTFEFDFQHVSELISLFKDGTVLDFAYEWDFSLGGFGGFSVNIGKTLFSYFSMVVLLIKTIVLSLWELVLASFKLFAHLVTIVCNVLGFRFGEI